MKLTVLNPGKAEGEILLLDESLSFWGGFDPHEGRIIDRQHPQAGYSIAGKVLVMPMSRGSAGTPAGVAESLRKGKGPKAIILRQPDVNLSVGVMVAAKLYGCGIPVLAAMSHDYSRLRGGMLVSINQDGRTLAQPPMPDHAF
ncbi:MAG: DUF126 domain-containing protein [Kiloniellales bacterium]|nr:DUF126 domain-containing protein [Kiloniellales bacterium]